MNLLAKNLGFTSIIFWVFITSCKEGRKEDTSFLKDKHKSVQYMHLEVIDIKSSDIPNQIIYSGNLISSKKWEDNQGEKILIISVTEPKEDKPYINNEDDAYSELHVEQYILGNQIKQQWKIYDFVRHCPVDIVLRLASENSIYITDLDKNGVTETTIVYYQACKGDVSPSNMKLIMYDNKNKYALRGSSMVEFYIEDDIDIKRFEPNLSVVNSVNNAGYSGEMGRYENENDFKSPSLLLEFAREKWVENMIEFKK